jgi:hypothetical protein
MTTEHDLDTRLQAARGLREQDLPALSDAFLDYLHASTDSHQADPDSAQNPAPAPAEAPASVLAARQLVTDAHERRAGAAGRGRRRPGRKALVRMGVAMVAVTAAATTAVVITTPDQDRTPTASPKTSADPAPTASPGSPTQRPIDPPGGLTLVAAEAISFPYSLDPSPKGLTPTLSKSGGLSPFGPEPVAWTATYRSDDDPGFTFTVASEDLRESEAAGRLPSYYATEQEVHESGSVSVNGAEADFVRGDYESTDCDYVPSTPAQADEPEEVCSDSFAGLTWQRPDGQWIYLWGEGDTYSEVAALTSVASSIVDDPQPVPLQVGLSPEGWSVSSYEEGRALTLISNAEPSISNRISLSLQERWRGYRSPGDVLQGMTEGDPVEPVTVKGQPAQLVSVPDPFTGPGFAGREQPRRMWNLAAQFPDGAVFLLQAPDTLSRQDVLAIAEQVTYTP